MQKSRIEWTDYTINPIKGKCPVDCPYCLPKGTLILTSEFKWAEIESIKVGDSLVAFSESGRKRLKETKVTSIFFRQSICNIVHTDSGNDINATPEHKYLVWNKRWVEVNKLRKGQPLTFISLPAYPPLEDVDYKIGYICGITEGDGTFRYSPDKSYTSKYTPYWRLALKDSEALQRTLNYLDSFGIYVNIRKFSGDGMQKIETRRKVTCNRLWKMFNTTITTDSYMKGWMAGIFDAAGSIEGNNLRISQKEGAVLNHIMEYGNKLGFGFYLEKYKKDNGVCSVRLASLSERIRFVATVSPCISRKRKAILGTTIRFIKHPHVISKNIDNKIQDVYNLETDSHTYFADGFATHNCYARKMYERFHWDENIRFDWSVYNDLPKIKKPSRIFWGSTMELFGEWVDPEWMRLIFEAVKHYSQHTHIFLTKRPENLQKYSPFPENAWIGVSATNHAPFLHGMEYLRDIKASVRFISIEPLSGHINASLAFMQSGFIPDWLIIGRQTPIRMATTPKIEWITEIIEEADKNNISVFLKNNLDTLLPEQVPLFRKNQYELRQEFPKAGL